MDTDLAFAPTESALDATSPESRSQKVRGNNPPSLITSPLLDFDYSTTHAYLSDQKHESRLFILWVSKVESENKSLIVLHVETGMRACVRHMRVTPQGHVGGR